ncbi:MULTISPECIES: hypothetical protein [unclassified Gordonia (in: high G+C Gram-positive bacteria)]|uniref:hypothetical protein n=1 Tax=unclassified Gordonia (in: high G+C Gram-positive bacteria) TaxID=2657482 RepID=UPI00200038C2|nr:MULTISPECIES: hypothetical protein [unclassified Gordonia (in: high G+C Gram-positive bacteria)]UQE74746.1 hypothetical protein MYK68_18875 [Gordonia sp. PP30]
MSGARQRDRVRSLVAEAQTPIDAQSIASALDIHVTTARFHLNNLVDEGAAVAVALPPDGVGRPRMGYRIVVAPPIDDLLIMLITRLGDTPEARERLAVEVGRGWAAKHLPAELSGPTLPDPVVIAETILTRLGFRITGVVSAFGDHEITLCGCPLQELEHELPEVARGVVRGILEEALAEGSAALQSSYAVLVRPDAAAGACELRLTLARTAGADALAD